MISGSWLNKTKDKVTYKLLLSKDKISIVAISIVKCDEHEQESHLFLRVSRENCPPCRLTMQK